MKLFLIRPNIDLYDAYDSAVVAAEDEDEARHVHPGSETAGKEDQEWLDQSWCLPEHVVVTYLGEAAPGINKGVVCASYNAG